MVERTTPGLRPRRAGGTRRPRRRLRLVGVLAALTAALLAGCSVDAPAGSSAATSAAASAGASSSGGLGHQVVGKTGDVAALQLTAAQVAAARKAAAGATLGVVAPLSAEYLSDVVDGAKTTAAQLGMKVQVVDYNFDASQGVSGIESLVSQGVKYMVVVLTDPPAMIGAVKAAEAQGVTVVQFAGQQVAQQAGGYSVAIDDAQLGTAAGEAAAKIAAPLGAVQVAVLDYPSQPNVVVRADAMVAALAKGAPQAQVVARVPGGTQQVGLDASESLLQKYPQLRGVLSVNDAGAYGAVQAFQQAGRTAATAFVTGSDGESKARQEISTGGIFAATVDTQPTLTGQAAVSVIGELLAGQDVDQYTTVPVKTVTR